MRKPKIKKHKNYWLVYRTKKQAVQCFSRESASLWYGVLNLETKKEKRA